MPRFPFFLVEGLKRAVDHSHKAKLLNLDRAFFTCFFYMFWEGYPSAWLIFEDSV